MVRIGIVAGEASGDLLGSHLIEALKTKKTDIEFVGIAGPKMLSAGASTWFSMEKLSVRGYVEVIKHLPALLKLRKALLAKLLENPPQLFIGVDAPDFNFWLEKKLKQHGIPTIHYVSPSIWAWRKGRMGKIKKAVSHVLALFPFETALYEKAEVPVTYVGHPLADMLPIKPSTKAMRETLKLQTNEKVFAMLPGSRVGEVEQHAKLFVKTAQKIVEKLSSPEEIAPVTFLVPLITRETRAVFEKALHELLDNAQEDTILPKFNIMFGHAHEAMAAADLVVVASGTATLEAALLKKPMIITYRMSALSWQILKRMRLQPYVGLPNILAGRFVVPELLQYDATPEKIAEAAMEILHDKTRLDDIKTTFTELHKALRQNAADKAAKAVLSYL